MTNITPTQADREAAAGILASRVANALQQTAIRANCRVGAMDHTLEVQAFAAHAAATRAERPIVAPTDRALVNRLAEIFGTVRHDETVLALIAAHSDAVRAEEIAALKAEFQETIDGYEAQDAIRAMAIGKLKNQLAMAMRLRQALEPFARAADIKLCGEWTDSDPIQQTDVAHHVTFGHLREARAALSNGEEGKS